MDRDIWAGCYQQLLSAYGKSLDVEQAGVYYEALETVPNAVVQRAVKAVMKESKFWPSIAAIQEACNVLSREMAAPVWEGRCAECHGDGWVDAEDLVQWGNTYRQVRRCPSCRPGVAHA